jgi:hypothetical protein
MTSQTDNVVFEVSGSGYPSIQYGTDSSENQAPGGYGALGDGSALPWSASMPYNPNALYYYVSAQLEGSGSISDSVTEVITTYCSNGSHQTESFPLASGNASGGYTIAQAEYSNPSGGDSNAQQAESDAGCLRAVRAPDINPRTTLFRGQNVVIYPEQVLGNVFLLNLAQPVVDVAAERLADVVRRDRPAAAR